MRYFATVIALSALCLAFVVPARARVLQVQVVNYSYYNSCDLNYEFANDPTIVEVGDTVLWIFMDNGVAHTVTSGTRTKPDGLFDSGLKATGTFQYTFNTAGTFPYYCKPHFGMDSSVVVKPFSPRGDVDGNGVKDMRDVAAALKLYAGLALPGDPGLVFANADVAPSTPDNTIRLADVFALIRFLNCSGTL